MEFIFTQMVLDMMVSTKTMKKMVLDTINGKTEDNIQDGGQMANNMEQALILISQGKRS